MNPKIHQGHGHLVSEDTSPLLHHTVNNSQRLNPWDFPTISSNRGTLRRRDPFQIIARYVFTVAKTKQDIYMFPGL